MSWLSVFYLRYRTFAVAPHVGSLTWANGVIPTSYGPIDVSWKQIGKHYSLRVTVPAGTTAQVRIPRHDDTTTGLVGTQLAGQTRLIDRSATPKFRLRRSHHRR